MTVYLCVLIADLWRPQVVGLYRLCGSAAVKKELRDAFERDSAAVTLNEELYPDINVITGQSALAASLLIGRDRPPHTPLRYGTTQKHVPFVWGGA